jgi:NTE family protein
MIQALSWGQYGGNEAPMHTAKIGLALGGGVARGWAHIGVIEALEEAGIKADVVCGCSIGALVGGAYVAGRLPQLKDWALSLNWRQIVAMLDFGLAGGGLINGQAITRKLRQLKIDRPIEDYAVPFAAVAAELASGHEVWIRQGPIEEAVRASISLPGILSPVRVDGRWLVDGALVNPVPVSACRALGADIIIAVNLNSDFFETSSSATAAARLRRLQSHIGHPETDRSAKGSVSEFVLRLMQPGPAAPGYFDVLITALGIMQDQITRSRLAGEPPQVLLMPRLASLSPMDFHRAAKAIEEGRMSVTHALPALRRVIRATTL